MSLDSPSFNNHHSQTEENPNQNQNNPNNSSENPPTHSFTPPDSPSGFSHSPHRETNLHSHGNPYRHPLYNSSHNPQHQDNDEYMQSDNGDEWEQHSYSSDENSSRENYEISVMNNHSNNTMMLQNRPNLEEEGEDQDNSLIVKERNIVLQILTKTNREGPIAGRTYYLLSSYWWKSWRKYVGYENRGTIGYYDRPGAIDNEDLLDDEGEVIRNKQEDIDYVFVPQDMWDYLVEWYGGGPPIPRPCIAVQMMGQPTIEVRKLPVRVIWSRKPKEPISVLFSKAITIGEFLDEMSKRIKLDRQNIRVFDFHNASKIKELNNMGTTFNSVPIVENQYILIEQRNKKGNWPNEKIYSRYSQSYYYKQDPTPPGKTGLANLGNTCFMASSLQCLSQTVPLVDYFLTKEYIKDVNPDNPLGQKGELAEQYFALLKELWSASTSVLEPRLFKKAIEKCDQRFSGYQQHDSQELLIFLLDGIHEDLNRVLVKPYVQKIEGDGKLKDEEVAEASWQGHKQRNNSIIVDNFQGLLKSTLTCPINGRMSTTFDPFMYLTVPIPIKSTRKVPITLFWINGKPTKFGVKVDKNGTIDDLLKELSKMTSIPDENFILTEIFFNRFYKVFFIHNEIADIGLNDKIFVYEIQSKKKLISQKNNSTNSLTNTTEIKIPTIEMPDVHSPQDSILNNTSAIPQESDSTSINCMPPLESPSDQNIQQPKEERSSNTLIDIPLDKEPIQEEEFIYLYVLWYRQGSTKSEFGIPFIFSVKKDITLDDLYIQLIQHITPYLSKSPIVTEESDTETQDPTDPVVEGEAKIKSRSYYKLFDLVKVSAHEYGYHSYTFPLTADDIRNKQTIAMNWDRDNYKEYYDPYKEEDFNVDPTAQISNTREQENEEVSLFECLNAFTKEEQLGPDDPWYCNDCKEFRQAFKKFDIWSAPPILIIHLKRFSYRGRFSFREKLDNFISFPLDNLDLSPFLIGPSSVPPIYELYSVSNHYGSLGSGHYTAYAKHRDDHQWYSFDDNIVRTINPEQVLTPNAYVLFYRRKDIQWNPFDPALDTLPLEESDTEEYDSSDERDNSPLKLIEYTESVETLTQTTWEDGSNNNNPTSTMSITDGPEYMRISNNNTENPNLTQTEQQAPQGIIGDQTSPPNDEHPYRTEIIGSFI